MKRKITSITDCGDHGFCEHKKENLKLFHYISPKTGRKSTYYGCPNHSGQIVQRKTTCECGKDLYSAKNGTPKLRCPKCHKIEIKKKNQRVYQAAKFKEKYEKSDKVVILLTKHNPYNCKLFDTLCGECIMVHGARKCIPGRVAIPKTVPLKFRMHNCV